MTFHRCFAALNSTRGEEKNLQRCDAVLSIKLGHLFEGRIKCFCVIHTTYVDWDFLFSLAAFAAQNEVLMGDLRCVVFVVSFALFPLFLHTNCPWSVFIFAFDAWRGTMSNVENFPPRFFSYAFISYPPLTSTALTHKSLDCFYFLDLLWFSIFKNLDFHKFEVPQILNCTLRDHKHLLRIINAFFRLVFCFLFTGMVETDDDLICFRTLRSRSAIIS